MKPAAMKSGKLYSQQPHSGAGDFNFSRADGVQTRINKHGLIETVADNEPRLSYDIVDGKVSDCPHLLLEPSRYNNLQRSEEFDNSYWSKNLVSVENNHVSPDGSSSADKIVSGNSTGAHFFRRTGLNYSSSKHTFSIFAKFSDELFEQFHFVIYDGSNHFAYFNVKDGVVGSADSGVETSIIAYPNGWYRCIVTYQTASASGIGQLKIELGDSTTETGDGSSGMVFWGLMWETGSYATSYIPTSGSTELRQTDICNGSGNSETFNDIESSLFLDIEAPYEDLVDRYITISDGGSSPYSNYLVLQYRSNGTMRIFHNGIDFADAIHVGGSSFDQTARHKIAVRFKEGDMKVYVDGVSQSINSSFVYQSVSGLNEIKFNLVGSSTEFHGKVHELSTFKEPLIDSELQLLTTP